MSERGRRLELCREWGSAIGGQTFESWLAERVIALEAELEKAKDKYTALFNKTQSTAMHASAAEGNGCSDCAIDQEACPVCYRVWWNKRHPNTNIVAADDSVVFAANRRAEIAESELEKAKWAADHNYTSFEKSDEERKKLRTLIETMSQAAVQILQVYSDSYKRMADDGTGAPIQPLSVRVDFEKNIIPAIRALKEPA